MNSAEAGDARFPPGQHSAGEGALPAKRRWRRLVSIAVSVATIALLLWLLDFDRILAVLKQCDPVGLAGAIVVGLVAQVFAGWRLRAGVQSLDQPVPLGTAIRIHFTGLWFNQVLPTGLGGDVVRVVSLQRLAGWTIALRAVLLDRVYGLAFLLLLCAVQAPVYYSLVDPPELATVLTLIGAGGVVVLALVTVDVHGLKWFVPARLSFVSVVVGDFRRLAFLRPSPQAFASSLMFAVTSIACYALVGGALQVNASFLTFMAFAPLVFVAMQFPISYGGWGPRELATIWLFSLTGVANEQAFAMSVLFGLVLTLSALPGVAFLMGRRPLGAADYQGHDERRG